MSLPWSLAIWHPSCHINWEQNVVACFSLCMSSPASHCSPHTVLKHRFFMSIPVVCRCVPPCWKQWTVVKQTKNLCQGTAFHKHKVPQKEQRQENNAACNLNRKLLQSVFKTWMTLQLVTVTTPALNSPSRSSTAAPHVGKEVLTLSSCSCTIPSISAGLWLPLHLSKILAFVPFLANYRDRNWVKNNWWSWLN